MAKIQKKRKLPLRFNRNPILSAIGEFKHTVFSTYLCLKYPFLYPRNVFTNRHYNNWAIIEYERNNYDKVYETVYDDDKLPVGRKVINRWMYVWFKVLDFIYDYILSPLHCIPSYSYYDRVPEGWQPMFLQLCSEIKPILKSYGSLYTYRLIDVKEKYGVLAHDSWHEPEDVGLIWQKYEYISMRTCNVCGRPARYLTTGYILPYCKDCIDEYDYNSCYIYGTKDLTWYGWTSTKCENERIKRDSKLTETETEKD